MISQVFHSLYKRVRKVWSHFVMINYVNLAINYVNLAINYVNLLLMWMRET